MGGESDPIIPRDDYDSLPGSRPQLKKLIRPCSAEFIGVGVFVYIGTLQGMSGGGILVPAFAHGITIALLIMAFGHISGAHLNPAVTVGVTVSGNMHVAYAAAYIVSQLAGGLVGSLLARACVTEAIFTDALGGGLTKPPIDAATNDIAVGWFQLILVELVLTFLLVTVVLNAAIDHEGNALAPFAIGLAVFVDILAGSVSGGKISGASLNPARSFGPAIVGSIFGVDSPWAYHYVYWIGPLVGGVLAGVVYKFS